MGTSNGLMKESRRDDCLHPAMTLVGKKANQNKSPGGPADRQTQTKIVFQRLLALHYDL